jgi:hypothetical protein
LSVKPAAKPEDPAVHDLPAVVLLDEREFTLGNPDRNPVIPLLLNGFHATNRYLYKEERSRLREFSVFCPKAFAGVQNLPARLAERCIPIELKCKLSTEKVEDWDWSFARTTAAPLIEWLKKWSELNFKTLLARAKLMAMTPSERFNVREREVVRPLLILAHLVGPKWLESVDASLQWLKLRSGVDTLTDGLKLLSDVRRVFNDHKNPPFIPTRDLVAELQQYESRPWVNWNSRNPGTPMANLLRPFGIRPTHRRIDEKSGLKVYCYEDFQDAWHRYEV